MGIDLSASLSYGTSSVTFNNANPFTANSPAGRRQFTGDSFGATPSVQATLRAMESAGVVRTLAEPNLTAISGEVRELHRRRRISDPRGLHLPTDHQRRLRATVPAFGLLQEVRHLAQFHAGRADRRPHQPARDDRSVRNLERELGQPQRRPRIPSIKTRRAETSLEIPSGGAMAMAGLINQQTKQAINGMPGLRACRSWVRCSAAGTSSTTRPN